MEAPRLRALLIAIADYPAEGGYARLNAHNDVVRMRAVLQQRGFDSTDIAVVQDGEATRVGILGALETLRAAARPGDVIVIHYSGHGDRITDENGDEQDGLDELLVPHDAPYDTAGVRSGAYAGERHIRDDELDGILVGLREAVWRDAEPGSVVVFLDACFSGSATRGAHELPARGTVEPLGAPAARGGGAAPQGTGVDLRSGGVGSKLAPLVVFSAARDDEVAREVRDRDRRVYGSLTLAVSRALGRSTDASVTYRSLFHRVAAEIHGMGLSQRPQVEGATDMQLFSGQSVVQRPFFQVAGMSGDTVRVRGGELVGLRPGSEVTFFPPNTADPLDGGAEPLARGVVYSADELSARVIVDGGTPSTLRPSWAFLTRESFGDMRIRLLLDGGAESALRERVRDVVAGITLVQIVDADPDLVLAPSAGGSTLQLRTAQEDVLLIDDVVISDSASVARFEARLRTFARGVYLRDRIRLSDPDVRVDLEIEPVHHTFDADGICTGSEPLDPAAYRTHGGEWQLGPGDGFRVHLTNTGTTTAYVALLYLMPDGRPFQLFPSPEHSGDDNRLGAGARYTVPLCYTASRTPGAHMLKLFATRERVDFEPLIASGGAVRGDAGLSPLEQLFAGALGGRDPGIGGPPSGAGTTSALVLHIVPRAR